MRILSRYLRHIDVTLKLKNKKVEVSLENKMVKKKHFHNEI